MTAWFFTKVFHPLTKCPLNLLLFDQQPSNYWFQRFPNCFRGHKEDFANVEHVGQGAENAVENLKGPTRDHADALAGRKVARHAPWACIICFPHVADGVSEHGARAPLSEG